MRWNQNGKIPLLETGNPQGVFLIFSALNAFGYDDENNPKGMSLARKKTRAVFKGYRWTKTYPILQKTILRYNPYYLLTAFFKKPEQKAISALLANFLTDLQVFTKEQAIQRAWKICQSAYAKEEKKMFPIFLKEATGLCQFIGSPPRLKKILLITNPLDAYWRGYAFRINQTGYIVVGPDTRQNGGELVRHELLHILAPPLRIPRQFTKIQEHQRAAAAGYNTSTIINREYVIRGINLLYKKQILKQNIANEIHHEEKDFPYIRNILRIMINKKCGIYGS